MSTVPFEYAVGASAGVGLVGYVAVSVFDLPHEGAALITVFVGTYILYSYSPLPQGPQTPRHNRRKRMWGFAPEHEDRPQRKFTDCEASKNE